MSAARKIPQPTDPAVDVGALVPVQTDMEETWLPVIGQVGNYEVSNLGRVRSLDRIVNYRMPTGRVVPRRRRGRVIQGVLSNGYPRVALGVGALRFVHHLVLEAFVGPRPDGMEALHGNGNPADGRLNNLRWGTKSENQLDTIRHGTHANKTRWTCRRGAHLLVAPNLIPSALPGRTCKACYRAGQWARSNGHDDAARDSYANASYAKIMQSVRPVRQGRLIPREPAKRRQQEACRRHGHLLAPPNLVPSMLPARKCRACFRAGLWARKHGHDDKARGSYANAQYVKIMRAGEETQG